MAEFVKKGALGGYKVVNAGYSDPECSHVILTRDEYGECCNKLRKAEIDVDSAKREAEHESRRAKNEAAAMAQKAAQDADEQVKSIQILLDEETQQRAYQEGLNANLLRISKERANADRKLRPKKEHTGYVVISSTQRQYKFKRNGSMVSVMLWDTVIQTPYKIDFTEEQARAQTQELFEKNENGDWPICRIGINGDYGKPFEKLIHDREWQDWKAYNVALERRYRANFTAGYWEIIITHTKALGIVPKDMRP